MGKHGVLKKLIVFLRRPLAGLKRIYKRRCFRKYASFGPGLDITEESVCIADKPGLIRLGKHCRVYGALQSVGEGVLEIGNDTCIYRRTKIGSVNSIRIGNCVGISNHVHIYDNNNHPVSPRVRREMCMEGFDGEAWRWTNSVAKPIVIEDDVWIGEYSAILKGVTIGRGAVVGCRSVVTKDVPPYTIVAGNPARVVKEIPEDER